jgi:Na+-transporting NADH:ubiquinone oxidoreductase subunit NqrB
MQTFFRRILTYRLMLYYMAILLAVGIVLCAAGSIHFRPLDLAFSALVIGATCWSINWVFARSFGATSHADSVLITALILVFMITPFAPGDGAGIGFAVFASAWAVASKYLLAPSKRHIFNPAAFGAALAGLALHRTVSWWVGDYTVLLPVIVAGGALLLQRLRYFDLLASFAVTVVVILLIHDGWAQMANSVSQTMLHSMFCFFAFVMLTEPRTTPLGRWRHIGLGVLVGILYSPVGHLGGYYFTPEVALLVGNAFTFVSNGRRVQRWAAAWA